MTYKFIAPNGARVVIADWPQFVKDFSTHLTSKDHQWN